MNKMDTSYINALLADAAYVTLTNSEKKGTDLFLAK